MDSTDDGRVAMGAVMWPLMEGQDTPSWRGRWAALHAYPSRRPVSDRRQLCFAGMAQVDCLIDHALGLVVARVPRLVRLQGGSRGIKVTISLLTAVPEWRRREY